MKANRFKIGEVIQEIHSDYFDVLLMKKAKDKSNGIDQTILAFYIILRAEELAVEEKLPKRK